MKTKLTTLLFLWLSTFCWAQQNMDSRSRRISVIDGLKSNNVYCIKQDRFGYIWFGTENGLSRYDGYRFVNFTHLSPNRKQTTDKRVGSLELSKDGKQLKAIMSSKDTAVYDFKYNKFLSYHKFIYRKGKSKGTSMIAHADGYRFYSPTRGSLTIEAPSGKKASYRLLDYVSPSRANLFKVAGDGNGTFYIATYGSGLYVYNAKKQTMEHFTALDANPLISSNFLTDVMVDSQKNVWVGCEASGVCCISPSSSVNAWYVYPVPNSREPLVNDVRCIYPMDDWRYLVGTKSGRNYYYDVRRNLLTFAFEQKEAIYSYFRDSKGKTWIGTQGERIYDIVEDKLGRIWKASLGKGVFVSEQASGKLIHTQNFLADDYNVASVRDLELSADGRLWISTNAGLYSVDTNEKRLTKASFHREMIDDVLEDEEVEFVHVSAKGNIWISILGDGLVKARYEAGHLRLLLTIDSDKGLPINNVRSVRELPTGDLWVALEEGICFVSADGQIVRPYSFSTNVESNDFSENTSAICKDGKALFGTRYGMLVIQGNLKPEVNTSNRVVVTDLMVNGSSLFMSGRQVMDEIQLEHNENSIVFNYTDFNYGRLSSHLYQYYLEGVDKEWHEPTSQDKAVYNNLSPGKYVFHIKKQGAPEEQEAVMTVTILPPIYNTWWAWLIYILVLGTVGFILFSNGRERFRLRQQLKMDKQVMEFRINFFTHIAHEFRTPIAIIQNAVNKMKEGRDKPVPRQALSSAVRGSNRLTRLINQLMDFRRINTGNLQIHVAEGNIVPYVRRIYQDFWDMAKQKEQTYTFMPFAKECVAFYDEKVLETILYNLISNAIKYTPMRGIINVRLGKNSDGQLEISVENNGPAITEQQLQHLFEPFMHGYVSQGGMGIGLYMAHRMAELHHGALAYERKYADTSVFKVILPMDNEAYSIEELSKQKTESKVETSTVELEERVQELLPKPLNDYHVAIVEDDLDMLEQVKSEVGRFFHVAAYSDGKSAIEGILSSKPQVILCDVMMPDITGYEVVKRLRADDTMRNVPIVMLTSMDDDSHQIKAYQVGADDYIIKPCNYKVLLTRIAQLIKWRNNDKTKEESRVAQEESSAEDGSQATKAASSEEPKVLLSIEDKRFLEQIDYIISSHLSDFDFNVSTLADQVNIGRTTLFGRFKKVTGMSPNKYILKVKMEHARQLLTDTDLTISEVGYKVGIDESSYFYRLFKNFYGMSPSQYRKQKADS